MLVRREREGDEPAIHGVHTAAFARADATGAPPEAGLVDALRASAAWIPALSLVAVVDGAVVGHVVCSRAWIDDRLEVLGLGPLGVLPSHQRAGVGQALMHAVLGGADALDEPVVALLGRPAYYRWFGFRPARSFGIAPPEERYGDHFQARLLTAAPADVSGRFRYAPAFEGL